MRKAITTAAIVAMSLVGLRADVTLVQTMTMEGAAAAAMGGALPRITMRIKGQRSRADVEMNGQTITSIADIATGQIVLLNSATKTATIMTPNSGKAMPMPNIDVTVKPTGKSQTIEGQTCDEHSLAMTLQMADVVPEGKVPPEAAAMMADVKMVMNGSIWIAKTAPGASEFAAFNKAAIDSNLYAALTGTPSNGSGPLEKLLKATAGTPGLPYLTEITMQFEGTGPMVDAMKQMGPMKMVQKISSVSTAPVAEDIFTIPADYTVEKK
jgi:hypothetical protein